METSVEAKGKLVHVPYFTFPHSFPFYTLAVPLWPDFDSFHPPSFPSLRLDPSPITYCLPFPLPLLSFLPQFFDVSIVCLFFFLSYSFLPPFLIISFNPIYICFTIFVTFAFSSAHPCPCLPFFIYYSSTFLVFVICLLPNFSLFFILFERSSSHPFLSFLRFSLVFPFLIPSPFPSFPRVSQIFTYFSRIFRLFMDPLIFPPRSISCVSFSVAISFRVCLGIFVASFPCNIITFFLFISQNSHFTYTNFSLVFLPYF